MADASGQPDANRVRDHLANERTFLAWIRTALAVMAVGLGIVGLSDSMSTSTELAGAILVGVGAAGMGYGSVRYRQVTREIESGISTSGSRSTGALVASTGLALAVIAVLVILTVGRR